MSRARTGWQLGWLLAGLAITYLALFLLVTGFAALQALVAAAVLITGVLS